MEQLFEYFKLFRVIAVQLCYRYKVYFHVSDC